MFRIGSLALASVVALGLSAVAPNTSRADFGFSLNLGRSHIVVGNGPRVVPAPVYVNYPVQPAPVIVNYPVRPAPVVVDYGCQTVVPGYTPYPVGYRSYNNVVIPPYHHHHDHYRHY